MVLRRVKELTTPYRDAVRSHTDGERAELKTSVEREGVLDPLEVTADGRVIDGSARLEIAHELGLDTVPCHVVPNIPDAKARARTVYLNVHRRHLTSSQKRQAIDRLLRLTPEKSDRALARAAGADKRTVRTRRDALEATGEIPRLTATQGEDGKTRRRKTRRAASARTVGKSSTVQAAHTAALPPSAVKATTPESVAACCSSPPADIPTALIMESLDRVRAAQAALRDEVRRLCGEFHVFGAGSRGNPVLRAVIGELRQLADGIPADLRQLADDLEKSITPDEV